MKDSQRKTEPVAVLSIRTYILSVVDNEGFKKSVHTHWDHSTSDQPENTEVAVPRLYMLMKRAVEELLQ